MSPSASSTSEDSTVNIIEQDVIEGFGFALGGVIASIVLIWVGGNRIKKLLKGT
jgi:hypothetical protein